MKSLFANKEETVTVTVYSYINEEKGEMYITEDRDHLIKKVSAPEDKIQVNSATFRVPTFGDNKEIYEDSVRIENGGVHVDPIKLKHNKFVVLVTIISDKRASFAEEISGKMEKKRKSARAKESRLPRIKWTNVSECIN